MRRKYPPVGVGTLGGLVGKTRNAFYEYQRRATAQALLNGLVLALVADIREDLPRLGTRKLYFLLLPRLGEHAPRVKPLVGERHHPPAHSPGHGVPEPSYRCLFAAHRRLPRPRQLAHQWAVWPLWSRPCAGHRAAPCGRGSQNALAERVNGMLKDEFPFVLLDDLAQARLLVN